MQDVIFAGTRERKPLGMAEVTLTLVDPEAYEGPIPVEPEVEVEITTALRRLGRRRAAPQRAPRPKRLCRRAAGQVLEDEDPMRQCEGFPMAQNLLAAQARLAGVRRRWC
jgi:chromosome segregation protein